MKALPNHIRPKFDTYPDRAIWSINSFFLFLTWNDLIFNIPDISTSQIWCGTNPCTLGIKEKKKFPTIQASACTNLASLSTPSQINCLPLNLTCSCDPPPQKSPPTSPQVAYTHDTNTPPFNAARANENIQIDLRWATPHASKTHIVLTRLLLHPKPN